MRYFLALVGLAAAFPFPASSYSVLTHEAIIDSAWDAGIKPILLDRFPNATPEQLREAHGYAYGGAIIQDLGYYPFGSRLFSDLVHYVRTGDFVRSLVAEAATLNELAFALGTVAHYAADNQGHPVAVNPAVAMLYPKLRRKYGDTISYEHDPAHHMKVEFAFDVTQVANGFYAPEAYRDFIGFGVSKEVLERAFLRTYGLTLADLFLSVDLAIGTYRHTVGTIIPQMTEVAWQQKRKELIQSRPGLTRQKFIYNLSRASFEKEWGDRYQRPGPWDRFLGWLLHLVPKIGPFRALSFRPPTPEAERLFMRSFNLTLTQYRSMLADIRSGKPLNVPDTNFDTGQPTRAGAYCMADEAVEKLVVKLADKDLEGVDARLRANLLDYFRSAPPKDEKARKALALLREQTPATAEQPPLERSPEPARRATRPSSTVVRPQ